MSHLCLSSLPLNTSSFYYLGLKNVARAGAEVARPKKVSFSVNRMGSMVVVAESQQRPTSTLKRVETNTFVPALGRKVFLERRELEDEEERI